MPEPPAVETKPSLGRILVVDDEPDHRTTLRGILERITAAVEDFGDPFAALAAVENRPFDVAICDLRLPGTDGLTIMRQLRERQPNLKVVILTAYPSGTSCSQAMAAGAAAYLEKPFSPEALRALICALLAGDEVG